MICTSSLKTMACPPEMARTESAVPRCFDHRGREGLAEPLLRTQRLPTARLEAASAESRARA